MAQKRMLLLQAYVRPYLLSHVYHKVLISLYSSAFFNLHFFDTRKTLFIYRCEALDFQITKSQKKILKRMAKFLRNELSGDKRTNDSDLDTPDNIGK